MTENYPRVIQKRGDITFPKDCPFNSNEPYISKFNDLFAKTLNKGNPLPHKGKIRSSGRDGQARTYTPDPQTLIVREQTDTDHHPHYHYIALVKGRAYKNGHYIHETTNRAWNTTIGLDSRTRGYVNNSCQYGPDYYMLDRNQPDFDNQQQEALRQAEYLAKTKSKEHNPKGSCRVTGTRIPQPTT
jgi:hypothetical protein